MLADVTLEQVTKKDLDIAAQALEEVAAAIRKGGLAKRDVDRHETLRWVASALLKARDTHPG